MKTKIHSRLWRTACHEAGHALACYYFQFPMKRVSIVPEGNSLGRVTNWKMRMESQEFIEIACRIIFYDRATTAKIARWHDEIVVLLAGGEADRLLA